MDQHARARSRNRSTLRAGVAGVVALIAVAAARPAFGAEPTAEDKAGARAAATQANAAFVAKRYADALDLFNRAESLMHAPTHVLMIARSQVAMGQLVRGRESYLALVHETLPPSASPAFKAAQVDGQAELAALEPRVPTVSVKADDPNVKRLLLTMDGTPIPPALVGVPRPVDPGTHVFKARGENVASDDKSVKVDEGARVVLVLPMKPAPGELGATAAAGEAAGAGTAGAAGAGADTGAPPPSTTMRTLGFVGIGVGAAGLVAGGILYGLGVSKRGEADDAYKACGSESCVRGSAGFDKVQSLDGDANTKETAGAIAMISGAVIAAGGVTLLFLAPKSEPAPAATGAVTVRPWLGWGSAGFRGSF